MSSSDPGFSVSPRAPDNSQYVGHAHFWERALSRREFIGVAAGVTGAVATSAVWFPSVASAHGHEVVAPRPIPGGIQPFGPGTELFHVFPPDKGTEPSTIFDFDGTIGAAIVDGTGTARDAGSGHSERLKFDTDMRFFKGRYVGVDGHQHHATFAFI